MAFYMNKTIISYGDRTSSTRLRMASTVKADASTDATDIDTAIAGVVLGTQGGLTLTEETLLVASTGTPPTNTNAQRGQRWLVGYSDNTNGERGTFEIASANPALIAGTDERMDITTAASPGLALKTALEAGVVNKAGNAITVNYVQYVNRNIQ